jgi:hypothetical protein
MLESEPEVRRTCFRGQDGPRLAFQRGEVAHEIIERLQLARPCILHHPIEPAVLRFAREDRNAQRLGLTDFQRDLRQHGETARSVEAADTDRQARANRKWGLSRT